jgi:hypothetical protein
MNKKNLVQHAREYYKCLFGPALGNLFQLDHNLWKPEENLNMQDNADLTRHFSEYELNMPYSP